MIQRQSQQRPHHHKAQRHDDDAANSMLETFFNGPVVFMRNQIDVNDSSRENEKCGDASRHHESNEMCIIPPSNAVVDPLAMMVTTINAIVAHLTMA